MSSATGEGPPPVEGVEERDPDEPGVRNPGNQDHPDRGPAMAQGGAQPAGNAMDNWATAMPSTDATKPETMPNTESEPLPGESEDRDPV